MLSVPAQERHERAVALFARGRAGRRAGPNVLHEVAPEMHVGESKQVVLTKRRHSSVWPERERVATHSNALD
jgi:hypothetical protein